jgi:hypothetical protein
MNFDFKISGVLDEEEQMELTEELFQDIVDADVCDDVEKFEIEDNEFGTRRMGVLTEALMFTVQIGAGMAIEELIRFVISWARRKQVTVNIGGIDITGNEKDIANIIKMMKSDDNNDEE